MKTKLKTNEFDYFLPENLIAHTPCKNRSESKLLHLNKGTSDFSDLHFSDILSLLTSGDVLVLNNSRVIKARLHTQRKTGAKIEIFLLEKQKNNHWTALIKNSKKLAEGEILDIGPQAQCVIHKKNTEEGTCLVQLISTLSWLEVLDLYGNIPLPPYIHNHDPQATQEKNYQTVFAKTPGSVAAPTAGLHFTKELLAKLKKKGIQIETVTLHVGYGTFKPIQTDYIEDHQIHEESYMVSKKTAERLNQAVAENRRIIAVGTTSARTLESAFQNDRFISGSHRTSLFIYPGYTFKIINGLITNFHLPKSSLLCLISAFIGKTILDKAYEHAIHHHYRFYSFGDAMAILP